MVLLTIAEKCIVTFEFLWATLWAWLLIMAGGFAVYRYLVTSEINYLFGILVIIVGVWYVFNEWKEYLKEHGEYK